MKKRRWTKEEVEPVSQALLLFVEEGKVPSMEGWRLNWASGDCLAVFSQATINVRRTRTVRYRRASWEDGPRTAFDEEVYTERETIYFLDNFRGVYWSKEYISENHWRLAKQIIEFDELVGRR